MSLASQAPDLPAGARCAGCHAGPQGIAGHEELFSQTMGSDHMHFRCRACGTIWVRRGEPGLRYSWTPSEQVHGADTPGKPGMAPP